MTLALFALGCTAMPFVPPGVCGKAALIISGLGAFVAFIELELKPTQSRAPQMVGLVANGFVLLFALYAASGRHVIDCFEGSGLLELIWLAPFAAILLFLGTFIWRIWYTFWPPPDLPPALDLPPAEDLPSAEPIDCLQCGTRIKAGKSKCPKCGWSYNEDQGPV